MQARAKARQYASHVAGRRAVRMVALTTYFPPHVQRTQMDAETIVHGIIQHAKGNRTFTMDPMVHQIFTNTRIQQRALHFLPPSTNPTLHLQSWLQQFERAHATHVTAGMRRLNVLTSGTMDDGDDDDTGIHGVSDSSATEWVVPQHDLRRGLHREALLGIRAMVKNVSEQLFRQLPVSMKPSDCHSFSLTTERYTCPPPEIEFTPDLHLHPTQQRDGYVGEGCVGGLRALFRSARQLANSGDAAAHLAVAVEQPSYLWAGQLSTGLYLRVRNFIQLERNAYAVAAKQGQATIPTAMLQQLKQYQSLLMNDLVIGALVGDGAAAMLLVNDQHPLFHHPQVQHMPLVIDSIEKVVPMTDHLVGHQPGVFGRHWHLSTQVPKTVAVEFKPVITNLLHRNNLTQADIHHVALHPGGVKVIQEVQHQLNLTDQQLHDSWQSLADHGNCVSVSVLNVLDRKLKHRLPPNTNILCSAVGPGLNLCGGLLVTQSTTTSQAFVQ